MPSTEQDDDRLVLSAIKHWREIAREKVDDIRAWRDEVFAYGVTGSTRLRSTHSRYDSDEPDLFWGHTSSMLAWITRKFPALDSAPIREIYAAVSAFTDGNAFQIPRQNLLEATLNQALILCEAMEREISSRSRSTPPTDADRTSRSNKKARPKWNDETGELIYNGAVVKQIKHMSQANNVVAVLDAFQENGWRQRIVDPLPGGRNPERLGETIRSLNRGLTAISFERDGSGKGVRWMPVE